MDINTLMRTAADGYPDGFTDMYWDYDNQCVNENGNGDTLAQFIVVELSETFDEDATEEAQLEDAMHVLSNAVDSVEDVRDTLRDRLNEVILEKEEASDGEDQ